MKIPFFDLRRHYLAQKYDVDRAILGVLESGSYILGNEGKEFERLLKYFLVQDKPGVVIGCSSGTDSLVLSLTASGIEAGSPVITVSHTAIPTIAAIQQVGGIPQFVDIDPQTWLMDLDALKASISPDTKVILAVHLYGNMVSIPDIQKLLIALKREDIIVIEDAAQAHGSLWGEHQAGTVGRFGSFSFYPTKNLGAVGDAGAVFCRKEEDGNLLRMLRNYGQKDRYSVTAPKGINSRLDEIQAAVLSVGLPLLSSWNDKKTSIMKYYREGLAELPIQFQKVHEACKPAWHLGVIALESEPVRNNLIKYLAKHGIETIIHYPIPTHLQNPLAGNKFPSLRTTESLAKRILSLPMNVTLKPDEQNYIIETIQKFF